ncbi:hypothetical protein BGP_2382 [Beggiatoa sp. PS]|nr:hypothetical protein BGP_2382 [Beggiatoa sp. PS]
MYQLTLQIADTQLEQSLRQIAQKEGREISQMALIAIQQFIQQYRSTTENELNDPWANPNIALPSIDTGITDFASNHDHYLYGTETIK